MEILTNTLVPLTADYINLKMKIDLPDPIFACKLLKSCNFQFQLALSITPEKTSANMEHILKKLFLESSGVLPATGSEGVQFPIKDEPDIEVKLFSVKMTIAEKECISV